MLALIAAMLLCVGLAVSVVGVVAIPARREGRDLFTHTRDQGAATPESTSDADADADVTGTDRRAGVNAG